MYAVPDIDEVMSIAKHFGIHLGPEEAGLYRRHLEKQMASQDAFVQSRIDEASPPLLSPAREPGYRPSAVEDPHNAWTWKCRVAGAPEGILAGKTISYKDHIAVAGMPMSFGCFALEGFVPDFDATVVTRVLEAGGTVVGKNTMNGFSGGYGFGGGIGDYGRPRNPHHREHVTGGSSSGSGAAVAAGEVDIAFGGDQGGSIRIPAALSGTVGLKPTFGLVSHFGISFGSDQSVDFVGPMARTVEDAAAALQATAGHDGYDARQGRDVPLSMDVLTGLTHGVSGLRIGVLEEGFVDVESDVRDLVSSAIDVLVGAGAHASKVSIPEHETVQAAQAALTCEGGHAIFETGLFGSFAKTYYPASLIAAVNQFWSNDTDLLTPTAKLGLIAAELSRRTYHGRVYAKAHNVRPHYVKAFDSALRDLDLLVMPTCTVTAPRYEAPATRLEAIEINLDNPFIRVATRNTSPYNFTGHPALAVPVGKSGGLPVSMQMVGRFFEDPLLLRVAYAYEHSVDWDGIIAIDD